MLHQHPVRRAEPAGRLKPGPRRFSVALHLGDVFYGNIGTRGRLDFTVIGPAVNEASRIQGLCRSLGQNILVSSTFKRAADSKNGLESLGFHRFRGVEKPQELFGLIK